MKPVHRILWQGVAALFLLTLAAPAAVPKSASARPAGGATPRATTNTDTLEFSSGDRLRGTFVSFDKAAGVRWRHPAIEEVVTVKPSALSRIAMVRSRADPLPAYNCVATLANGDELTGQLVAADETQVTLETWFAGSLNISRPVLRSLWLSFGASELIYEGPTGPEGWTIRGQQNFNAAGAVIRRAVGADPNVVEAPDEPPPAQPSWEFRDGGFITTRAGTLGRDMKLPPESNLEFDLEWQNYPMLTVFLYADSIEGPNRGSAYALSFSINRVSLTRQTENGGTRSIGSYMVSGLDASTTKARFSIRTSLDQKVMALYVNGQSVARCANLGDPPGQGTAVMFHQKTSFQARLSNIRVSKWQGNLDDAPETAETAGGKDDLLVLANRDKISGHLVGIKEGKVSFKTPFSPIEIPLERVRRLGLASSTAAAPEKTGKPVRLVFSHRGALTLELEHWDEQSVLGRSPCLGEVKLVSTAFKTIEFDPAANRPAPVSTGPSTGIRRVPLGVNPGLFNDVEMRFDVQPRAIPVEPVPLR